MESDLAIEDHARKTALIIPIGCEMNTEIVAEWLAKNTDGRPVFLSVNEQPDWECHEHIVTPGWRVWRLAVGRYIKEVLP